MSKKVNYLFIFLIVISLGITSNKAYAHASLTDANPAPESELRESPNQIKVTFNERLSEGLIKLTLINDKGKIVTKLKPTISENRRNITLPIPSLSKGLYTVSYSVISSDGHPVDGSYVFSIGNIKETKQEQVPLNDQLAHNHDVLDPTNWIVRALYFFSLLMVCGSVLWKNIISFKDQEKLHYERWIKKVLLFYLFMLVGIIVIQGSELLKTIGTGGIRPLLLSTPTGWSWVSSIVLSIVGLIFLFKSKWFDMSWVFLLLLAKSLNGHAVGTSLPFYSIFLDVIHLIAAAIWSIGLLYLYYIWKQKEYVKYEFIYLFSKVAFISIVTLILTGSFYSLTLVTKISYLFHTTWGIFLLIKLFLVILVVTIGSIIRHFLKQKEISSLEKWIKCDFSLMIGIIIIVGTLTHLNPTPVNKPLDWEQHKDNVEVKITSSSLNAGNISFKVNVDSKDKNKIPESVTLKFFPLGHKEVSPIFVPLDRVDNDSLIFSKSGPYLPFAGEWKIEVNVITTNLDEIKFTKEIQIFDIKN